MVNNKKKTEAINFVYDKVLSMLSVPSIAEDSNLIEGGLSSINIMQISNMLRKYNIRISFAKLIEHPTLRDWNEILHNSQIIKRAPQTVEMKAGGDGDFELTDVQSAYFIGRRDDQPLGGVGCHAYLEFDGQNAEAEKLENAWNTLQRQHPMLRARFLDNGRQDIMPLPYSEKITIFNLQDFTESETAAELISIRNSLSHRKLKVEQGEAAGISLALLPNKRNRIFLNVDLLVADVLSLSIIVRDLAEVYMGNTLAVQPEYTFQDYLTSKFSDDFSADDIEKDRAFWEDKLRLLSIEAPDIPLKTKPELVRKTMFSRRTDIISKDDWNKIKQIAAEVKVTPSMVLLTCYALVLERWCNQDSFFINLPLFNRNLENDKIGNMVADFTSLLLVEYSRKFQEPFLNTLYRMKDTFLENAAHSNYSGVSVQRDIFTKMGGTLFFAPFVFACNIDYPLETDVSREAFGDISFMLSQTPQVWIDFQTYIKEDSLILCWDAVDELFPGELLDDMFGALLRLLHALTQKDNWGITHDVLPQRQAEHRNAELESILPLHYPVKTLLSDFLNNVNRYPERIALINGVTKKEITYKTLYNRAFEIADILVKSGVKSGDYVGITLPRGCKQIYAILGILLLGAVYVPVGLNQPKDRRKRIYQQMGLSSLITDTETMNHVSGKVTFEKPAMTDPTDSAYVITTSGSTGTPKGVEISHTAAVNTIDAVNQICNISSKDTAIMVSAIDFDLSVYDIFGMLSAGGKVVVLSEDTYKDPDLLLALIDEYAITVWNSVPILFDMLVTMAEKRSRTIGLRIAMLSGDWIGLELPQRFYNLSKDSTVVAMGGATEASIWSNYLVVPERLPTDWTSIPYGKPLKNQIYKVIDDFGRVCPDYVHGELWIGGTGVAKGYKSDEKLTKEKFITDTIRWYKTGDKGRTWDDGTIELLGRIDNQFKVSGYRIEAGEIEAALLKLSFITHAVVCVIEKKGDKIIAAYIVFKHQSGASIDAIKEALENYLPQYMLPSKFLAAEELPLTENGKPDKRKITALLQEQCERTTASLPQSTLEVEIEKVWKEVLQTEMISRADNFFRLGGNSLKAVEIVAKVGTALKLSENISIQTVFKSPTIQEFALEVDKLCSGCVEESI